MGIRSFLALFLLFLLLGFEVQGALSSQDEPTPSPNLSPSPSPSPSPTLLSHVYGYLDKARTAAQDLYQNSYFPTMDKKIRDAYSQSTAVVTIYAGIFTDQLFYMLKGEA